MSKKKQTGKSKKKQESEVKNTKKNDKGTSCHIMKYISLKAKGFTLQVNRQKISTQLAGHQVLPALQNYCKLQNKEFPELPTSSDLKKDIDKFIKTLNPHHSRVQSVKQYLNDLIKSLKIYEETGLFILYIYIHKPVFCILVIVHIYIYITLIKVI